MNTHRHTQTQRARSPKGGEVLWTDRLTYEGAESFIYFLFQLVKHWRFGIGVDTTHNPKEEVSDKLKN